MMPARGEENKNEQIGDAANRREGLANARVGRAG